MTTRTRHAQALFEGIAPEYEWMGGVLSFGQDPRWRRFLVSRVDAPRGASVLDVDMLPLMAHPSRAGLWTHPR